MTDLDISAALEYTDGDEDMLAVVLAAYLEETPQLIEGIRQSLATGNAAEVERFAHTIQGTTRLFPDSPIRSNATAIEQMAPTENFATAEDRLKAIEEGWAELSGQINAYLTKRRSAE